MSPAPQPLEDYPVTAEALPVAWDGHPISWGSWTALAAFLCARTTKRSQTACPRCGDDSKTSLAIQGLVEALEDTLSLLRCPNCAADTVVDENQNVWELDETDYGPEGSWDEAPPTLFEDVPLPRCQVCGREGETGMTEHGNAQRCADDELCARRAATATKEA